MSRLFLLVLVIVSSAATALSQPGPDHWRFDALDTCLYSSFKTDVAFVGHVVSVEESQNPSGFKLVAKVEKVFKGEVQQEQEIYMLKGTASEWSIRDKTFVFLANHIDREGFQGLFVERYSFQTDGKADEFAIIERIYNGVAQPRVVGTVTELPWLTGWINPRDPTYRPLAGITVIAEGVNGQQFTTETDEKGRFQFDKLPLGPEPQSIHLYYIKEPDQLTSGTYAFSVILPKKMDIHSLNLLLENGMLPHVQIGSALCSATVNFSVREAGTITGKILRNVNNRQSIKPQMNLYPIDPRTKSIYYHIDYFVPTRVSMPKPNTGGVISFSFEHIPAGTYILSIRTPDIEGALQTIYYPFTKIAEEAAILNVTAGKPIELEISLP